MYRFERGRFSFVEEDRRRRKARANVLCSRFQLAGSRLVGVGASHHITGQKAESVNDGDTSSLAIDEESFDVS